MFFRFFPNLLASNKSERLFFAFKLCPVFPLLLENVCLGTNLFLVLFARSFRHPSPKQSHKQVLEFWIACHLRWQTHLYIVRQTMAIVILALLLGVSSFLIRCTNLPTMTIARYYNVREPCPISHQQHKPELRNNNFQHLKSQMNAKTVSISKQAPHHTASITLGTVYYGLPEKLLSISQSRNRCKSAVQNSLLDFSNPWVEPLEKKHAQKFCWAWLGYRSFLEAKSAWTPKVNTPRAVQLVKCPQAKSNSHVFYYGWAWTIANKPKACSSSGPGSQNLNSFFVDGWRANFSEARNITTQNMRENQHSGM